MSSPNDGVAYWVVANETGYVYPRRYETRKEAEDITAKMLRPRRLLRVFGLSKTGKIVEEAARA